MRRARRRGTNRTGEVVMVEKRELEQGAEDRLERSEQLRQEALGYWQTALRGLFALPNATVLSVSSAVLYTTGIAEIAYKRIEALSGRIGGEVTRELVEVRRAATLPEPERSKRQPASS
jgi:hypothetical protein